MSISMYPSDGRIGERQSCAASIAIGILPKPVTVPARPDQRFPVTVRAAVSCFVVWAGAVTASGGGSSGSSLLWVGPPEQGHQSIRVTVRRGRHSAPASAHPRPAARDGATLNQNETSTVNPASWPGVGTEVSAGSPGS